MVRLRRLGYLIAAVIMLISCADKITVAIGNQTGEVIQNVVVRFTGGEVRLGPLNVGESQVVEIQPTGESDIELEIKLPDGRVVLRKVDTYVEPDYTARIKVSLGNGLVVHSETDYDFVY